jgi:hypothetical protein
MSTLPRTLGLAHKLAAGFLAVGARPGEVARRFGWHPSTLSHLQRMPAFRAEVEVRQQELRAQVIAATVQRIVAKPPPCPRCGDRSRSSHNGPKA